MNYYSESTFWNKLERFAVRLGKELLVKILILHEVLKDPDTPSGARATIVGALGYLIFPLDAIPDILPVVGFTDDLAAIGVVITIVAKFIKPSHVSAARKRAAQWFGTEGEEGETPA